MSKKVKLFQNKIVREDGEWFVHIYQEFWLIDDEPLILITGPFASRADARDVKSCLDGTLELICNLTVLDVELGGD